MCYALCMKNALKNVKVWIIGGVISVVGIGLPFLIFVITLNIDNAYPFQYPLLHGAIAAICLLIGYIWGDLHGVAYRRKEKNWDDKLPDEIKTECWVRRWPFFFGAITTFTVFLVFDIIFMITGSYPLL